MGQSGAPRRDDRQWSLRRLGSKCALTAAEDCRRPIDLFVVLEPAATLHWGARYGSMRGTPWEAAATTHPGSAEKLGIVLPHAVVELRGVHHPGEVGQKQRARERPHAPERHYGMTLWDLNVRWHYPHPSMIIVLDVTIAS